MRTDMNPDVSLRVCSIEVAISSCKGIHIRYFS